MPSRGPGSRFLERMAPRRRTNKIGLQAPNRLIRQGPNLFVAKPLRGEEEKATGRAAPVGVTALDDRNDRPYGRTEPRAVAAPFARPGSDTGGQARGAHSLFLDSPHRQEAGHYSVGRP